MQFAWKHKEWIVLSVHGWIEQTKLRDFIPFNWSEVMMNDRASSLQFCNTYRMKEEPSDWRSQYSARDDSSHGC